MFTSRAEYRLLLREDNADLRLGEKAHGVGLLPDGAFELLVKKKSEIEATRSSLKSHHFLPEGPASTWLASKGLPVLKDRVSAEVFLRRPEVDFSTLCELGFSGEGVNPEVQEQIEIQIKYEGYIRRDMDLLEGVRRSEELRIPLDTDFERVPGLSTEIRGRLKETRPETIGQASRLMGVTPAAVANLLIYLKMQEQRRSRVELK